MPIDPSPRWPLITSGNIMLMRVPRERTWQPDLFPTPELARHLSTPQKWERECGASRDLFVNAFFLNAAHARPILARGEQIGPSRLRLADQLLIRAQDEIF